MALLVVDGLHALPRCVATTYRPVFRVEFLNGRWTSRWKEDENEQKLNQSFVPSSG